MIDLTVDPLSLAQESGIDDTLIRQGVMPWDDLGAVNVPERFLRLDRRVIPSLALMAVQTPQGPKLVNADSAGNIGTGAPQQVLPSVQIAQSAAGFTQFATVKGMHSVGISLAGNPGDWTTLVLKGDTTGNVYLNTNPSATGRVFYIVPVLSAVEVSFTLSVIRTAAQPIALKMTPIAVLDTEAVIIGGQFQPPITAVATARYQGNFSYTNPITGNPDGSDVQRSVMAGGATVVFLAAAIYPRYQIAWVAIELEVTQADRGTLSQTDGQPLGLFSQLFAGPRVFPPSPHGSPFLLLAGVGLQTINNGAAATTMDISLQFTGNPLSGT